MLTVGYWLLAVEALMVVEEEGAADEELPAKGMCKSFFRVSINLQDWLEVASGSSLLCGAGAWIG